MKTFKKLHVRSKLCEILSEKGFTEPTQIQIESIPKIIKGKSVIAISNTGSGKTLAFVVPILNDLIKNNQHYHSLICVPTRELAKQIEAVFNSLGESLGLRVLSIIGGENESVQKKMVFKAPHVIIGTPGRLNLILGNILLLKKIKFLVLDESDKLLEKNYESDLLSIVKNINEDRVTLLFSATITDSFERLANICIKNPVKIEINKTFDTVEKLNQKYMFIPFKYKEVYLVELLKENDKKIIVFISNCLGAQTYSNFLNTNKIDSLALYGELNQEDRLKILEEFKKKEKGVLVATDVASRGIDIPMVERIINFDLPLTTKEYIHRIGRTARAGKEGNIINFVTQYDIQLFQKMEKNMGIRMDEYELVVKNVDRLNVALKLSYKNAYDEVKEKNENKRIKRRR